jgi:hypothetical protein
MEWNWNRIEWNGTPLGVEWTRMDLRWLIGWLELVLWLDWLVWSRLSWSVLG